MFKINFKWWTCVLSHGTLHDSSLAKNLLKHSKFGSCYYPKSLSLEWSLTGAICSSSPFSLISAFTFISTVLLSSGMGKFFFFFLGYNSPVSSFFGFSNFSLISYYFLSVSSIAFIFLFCISSCIFLRLYSRSLSDILLNLSISASYAFTFSYFLF